MAKGDTFEREICTLLSEWWSDGKRDDIFWRHDSGSRAKGSSRKGKTTFGAYGDIKASDPIGSLAFISPYAPNVVFPFRDLPFALDPLSCRQKISSRFPSDHHSESNVHISRSNVSPFAIYFIFLCVS